MIGYFDGSFLDESKIKISPFGFGFMYGKGIFTTLKCIERKFIFLDDHKLRLKKGLNFFGMTLPEIKLKKILDKLLKLNNLISGRIKIVYFENIERKTSVLINIRDLEPQPEFVILKTDNFRRNDFPIFRHKTLNYIYNIKSVESARKLDYDFSLFISESNQILEASYHNIFFIKNDKILTPPETLPILPGIIRKNILKINELEVSRKSILLNELNKFDAAFITNSVSITLPVLKINEINYDLVIGKKYCDLVQKLIFKN
jgi:4-amino-4-deoxychorismate lyase